MDKSNDTSVWKKEISFRKKPKSPEETVQATSIDSTEKTSVWKKEVSFGRKSKPKPPKPVSLPPVEAPPAAVTPAASNAGEKTSVWKKEIGFGRKSKDEAAADEAAPEKTEKKEKTEKTSIWKKEIGRKSKDKAPAAEAPAAEVEKKSVWKKEIGRKRKPKAETTAVAAALVAAEAVESQHESVDQVAPSAEVDPVASREDVLVPVEAEQTTAEPGPEPGPMLPRFIQAVGPEPESVLPPVTSTVDPEPGPVLPPVTPAVESEAGPVLPPVTPAAESDAGQMLPSFTPAVEPESGPVLPPVTPEVDFAPPAAPALPAVPPVVPVEDTVEAEFPVVAEALAVDALLPEAENDVPASEPVAEELAPESETPEQPAQSRRERREAKRADKGSKDRNQLVGLKLGASQIAAAQVVNKGGPKVVRMARMPLNRGVVVGGELREPEELATQLKAFFRKNKLPRNCVRLGISNNRIGVRTFEISGISDPKQLANAVRFQAQETLPIPLDEAVLDYRILEDRVGDDGVRVCRVLLVVAHRELVERYVSACRKAGLKLVGIDLEAFALLRALSDPTRPPGDDAAVVCVSIGHDRSTLAVSDGRLCEFTRVLAWGGSALDTALARVLDVTPSAAVPIKHALTLGEDGEAAGLDARHADEARRAMVGELQSFARELVASLRFYQEQPKSLGIVEILITGGAAACGGLAPELERLIGIPVRVADPFMRVKVQRTPEFDTAASTASMAVAVGLGIED